MKAKKPWKKPGVKIQAVSIAVTDNLNYPEI
jgi:hypothetical protein